MKQYLNTKSMVPKPQTWSNDYYTYVLLSQDEIDMPVGLDEEPVRGYQASYIQYTHEEFLALINEDSKNKVLNQLDQSIATVKSNKVTESKILLEQHYAQNPLFSTVHNPDGEHYSTTSDKQMYLMSMITLCEQSKALGIEFQPTWNASGELCEPWTELELQQLSLQIAQFVYPAVTQQQHYEKLIQEMTSVEDIQGLVISYV